MFLSNYSPLKLRSRGCYASFAVAIQAVIFVTTIDFSEARTWSSADGTKTFEGEFRSYDPEEKTVTVVLSGGQTITFSTQKLSKPDIAWVNEQLKPPPQELPAFPGAEGFGRFSHGGRAGKVYRVINLNDAGPGSLREAIEANGPRTIVFGVSGLIELKQPLVLRNGYCTIAGQTAPGAGICLKNYAFVVDNTSHVIVRYIRFRPGDSSGTEGDAVSVTGSNQIIIDHCSMSWATDAVFDVTKGTGLITVQWCIISECLYDSVHSGGPHSMGAGFDGSGAGGGSYHHNLLASCNSRMPRIDGFGDALVDLRNNVIYNWGGTSAYGGEKARMNFIGNYFKPGPATPDKAKSAIFSATSTESRLYLVDNFVDGSSRATRNPWDDPRAMLYRTETGASIETLKADQPFEVAPVTTHSARDAYGLVLQHAGASLRRDAVDTRLVEEVERRRAMGGNSFGEKTGIIDSPTEVGGWPEYVSEKAPADSDGDGMPDDWEVKMGLKPEDPEDGKTDADGDGYTNLEEYLNDIASERTQR